MKYFIFALCVFAFVVGVSVRHDADKKLMALCPDVATQTLHECK